MSVAAQGCRSVEDEYNKVADSLESIKRQDKEIKLQGLAQAGDELTKELEQLEIKKSLAEMIVQVLVKNSKRRLSWQRLGCTGQDEST